VIWKIVFSKAAQKDAKKIARSNLRPRVEQLLEILRADPYAASPRFERLVGDLTGALSRRINVQHRLVYQVVERERTVKVLRMWTHYE